MRPLSFIVVAIVGLAALTNEGVAQGAASVSMLPNYREVIARSLLSQSEFDRATLNTAKISKPFVEGGGLFGGGPIPKVCVSVYTKNMLGMAFTGYILFTVRNGQAVRFKSQNAILADQTCGPMSAFHEVMKK